MEDCKRKKLTKSRIAFTIGKSCISMLALAADIFNCAAVKLSIAGQKTAYTKVYLCTEEAEIIYRAENTVSYEDFLSNEKENGNNTIYPKGITCSLTQYRDLKKSGKCANHIFLSEGEFLKQIILEFPSFNEFGTALKETDWRKVEETIRGINITITQKEYDKAILDKSYLNEILKEIFSKLTKIKTLKVPVIDLRQNDPLFEGIAHQLPEAIKYFNEEGNIVDAHLTGRKIQTVISSYSEVTYTEHLMKSNKSPNMLSNKLPYVVRCSVLSELTSLFDSLSENSAEQKNILIIDFSDEFADGSIGKIAPIADGIAVIINGDKFNMTSPKIFKPIVKKAAKKEVKINKVGNSVKKFTKLIDEYNVTPSFFVPNGIDKEIEITRGENATGNPYYFVSYDTYCKLEENGLSNSDLVVKFNSCKEFNKLTDERQKQLKEKTSGVIVRLSSPDDKNVKLMNIDNITEMHIYMSTDFACLDVFKILKAKHGSKIKAIDQKGRLISLRLNENEDVYFRWYDYSRLTSEGYQINNLILRFQTYRQFTNAYPGLDTSEKKIDMLKKTPKA